MAVRGADFTLPTSVTTASVRWSASTTAPAMAVGGTATTTSCGRSPEAAARPAPSPVAVRTCSAALSRRITSRPRRRHTRATEVPIRPVPTTSTGPTSGGSESSEEASVMAGGPGEVAAQVGRTVEVDVGDVGAREVGLDVGHQSHDPRHGSLDLELTGAHQWDIGE